MLFKSLESLRGQFATIYVAVTYLPGGELGLIINPEATPEAIAKNPALGSQLSVHGPAEDLDAEFAASFGKYFAIRADVVKQADDQAEALKKAAKKPAAATSATPLLPAPSSAKASALDDMDLSGQVAATAANSQAASTAATDDTDSFFGED